MDSIKFDIVLADSNNKNVAKISSVKKSKIHIKNPHFLEKVNNLSAISFKCSFDRLIYKYFLTVVGKKSKFI